MTDTAELAREREERLRMIRDSAASLVPPDGDLGRVRRLRFSEPGVDRAAWAEVCAMGWPGLRLDEAQGGSGLGMAEYAALLEELGCGLLPEPLIEASLVAPLLPDAEREALLAGEKLVLPAGIAYEEGATLPQLRDGKLHGEVGHVALGAAADAWLVACDGGLALVERGAEGLRLSQEPTQDGGHLLVGTGQHGIQGGLVDAGIGLGLRVEAQRLQHQAVVAGQVEAGVDPAHHRHHRHYDRWDR